MAGGACGEKREYGGGGEGGVGGEGDTSQDRMGKGGFGGAKAGKDMRMGQPMPFAPGGWGGSGQQAHHHAAPFPPFNPFFYPGMMQLPQRGMAQKWGTAAADGAPKKRGRPRKTPLPEQDMDTGGLGALGASADSSAAVSMGALSNGLGGAGVAGGSAAVVGAGPSDNPPPPPA